MSADQAEDYRTTAARVQKRVLDSIRTTWRLTEDQIDLAAQHPDVRSFPETCGRLTDGQISLTRLTATELLEHIHSGVLSAEDVTIAFCARAAIAHQLVNCLTDFFFEEAIQQAKALDVHYAETGEPVGPLHGLPLALKDIMNVKGHSATMAYVARADADPATSDAAVVKILRDAGAVFFGRTTMPQSGMALETVSNLFGRTLNPYNPAFGAGGSSGGDGALVAMLGAPIAALSTDIGGSIRAPGAFNGLYAMRPTADRIPRTGLHAVPSGNISIKSSVGPQARRLNDVKLVVRLLLSRPTIPFEPSCSPASWTDVQPPQALRIGLLAFDGVVNPHPPVLRALNESVAKLQHAGHQVIPISLPFSAWEAAQTTFALYFQTGAKETKATLAAFVEPEIAQFKRNLEIFNIRELSVSELWQLNLQQAAYKVKFQEFWDSLQSSDGHTMDAILCPCAPMAGVPHDFAVWWGYFSLWNMLDYPSIVLPLKDFSIDAAKDPKDLTYKPHENPFDKANWELYDPARWRTQPVTVQVVGRPHRDEQLLATCEVIDGILNG